MKTDQPTKAAKRGRKTKDPTAVLTFRVPENKANDLKALISDFIKSYLNPAPLSISSKPGNEIKSGPPQAPLDPELPAATYRPQIKNPPFSEPSMAELLKQAIKQKEI